VCNLAAAAVDSLTARLCWSAQNSYLQLSSALDSEVAREVAFYTRKVDQLLGVEKKWTTLTDALPPEPLLRAALCVLTPHPDLAGTLWTAAVATVLRLPMPVELVARDGVIAEPVVDADVDVDELLLACLQVTPRERTLALDVLRHACSKTANTALAVRGHHSS
jgi:hypothetical protein